MDKKTKIFLGVGVPIGVFLLYWFLYRKREPLLNLNETNWNDDTVIIKFGRNVKSASLGDNGEMNAGATYKDGLYKLTFKTDGKLMKFYARDNNGNLIDKQTLDFGAKIRY
jgi:hypothetical protein